MSRFLQFAPCALLILLVAVAFAPVDAEAQLSGAIFTTTFDGTVVNGNTKYDSKCDVYLDGGPGPNAPQTAAGLPDGDYYFQVTDPSGKKLLSKDDVSNRLFKVLNGIIVSYSGTHYIGNDVDQGALTIQLANGDDCQEDFEDTPNNGGVYKAWVTPVGAYMEGVNGQGIFYGFVPAASKTDNFKVGDKERTYCILIKKVIVDDKKGYEPGPWWTMVLKDDLGVTNYYHTDYWGKVEVCALTQGDYVVKEYLKEGYQVVALIVNGQYQNSMTSYAFTLNNGVKEQYEITFVNEEVKKYPYPK